MGSTLPRRANARRGVLLVGTQRGGNTDPPEAQIVPQSPRAMRVRLHGMQLGHPSAATGDGKRSAAMRYWRQVRSWGRICGGGCRDLLS